MDRPEEIDGYVVVDFWEEDFYYYAIVRDRDGGYMAYHYHKTTQHGWGSSGYCTHIYNRLISQAEKVESDLETAEGRVTQLETELACANDEREYWVQIAHQQEELKDGWEKRAKEAEQEASKLDNELEKWESYSHPWVTEQGDPEGLTPGRVRELTDKTISERDALKEQLAQIAEQHRAIMEEPCGDEKHCTCVPILRSEIADLKKRLLAIRRIGEVCHSSGDYSSSDFYGIMQIAGGGETTDWLLNRREELENENDALKARVRELETPSYYGLGDGDSAYDTPKEIADENGLEPGQVFPVSAYKFLGTKTYLVKEGGIVEPAASGEGNENEA